MNNDQTHMPDWAPKNGGDAFAVRVRKGIEGAAARGENSQLSRKKRPSLSTADYVTGVLANDKTILARAITLVESNAPDHYEQAREVLKQLLPHTGQSLRIGVTGIPGGGKSTLIEALGCHAIDKGHNVAVLAIDPSSTVTRGSILGDKTRMEKLARQPHCFIRPSPSGGTLGGVARKSRETILVCEAAGYDTILIETVGVGQSEITVRSMVDFFLLIMIAGGGDELQGIKKGVIELADALAVNKADGQNKNRAQLARNEYAAALKYLTPATRGWQTTAYTCSALTGDGIPDTWNMINRFKHLTQQNGAFQQRRQHQALDWVSSMIEDYLKENFYQNPLVQNQLPLVKEKLLNSALLPTEAAETLLKTYFLTLK
jgi:LAO/AO transport system kinase